MAGWEQPLDARWLLRALVDITAAATKAEMRWPWLTVPAEPVSDEDMARAQRIAMMGVT